MNLELAQTTLDRMGVLELKQIWPNVEQACLATHGKNGYIDFSGGWAKEQGPNLYRAARANWLLNNLAAASVALLQSRAQLEM